MNSSSKQILALWLHKRGEKWSYKTSNNLQEGGVYHYRTKSGQIKSSIVIRVKDDLSEIIKVLLLFQAKKEKIDHIETRNVSTGLELYLEIISYSLSEWTALRNILETLNSIDIHPRETSTLNGKIGQGSHVITKQLVSTIN